jgi:SAM-dependent methyltransferase
MNSGCYHIVKAALEKLPPRQRVIEFGSLDVNGNIRALLGDAEYIGVDLLEGPNVTVVADAATYTPPWQPDLVLCLNMLEHAANAQDIVSNAYRMLGPGGVFIVSVPDASFPPHSHDGGMLHPGEYYEAFGIERLWRMLGDFAETVFMEGGQLIYGMGVRE